jgi:hypothetical protein
LAGLGDKCGLLGRTRFPFASNPRFGVSDTRVNDGETERRPSESNAVRSRCGRASPWLGSEEGRPVAPLGEYAISRLGDSPTKIDPQSARSTKQMVLGVDADGLPISPTAQATRSRENAIFDQFGFVDHLRFDLFGGEHMDFIRK